jgi:hypothetical protein
MEHMSGVNLGDRDVFLKGDISRPPPGYSMLEQYARDWGFGKNLGSVHKKHRHNCEWAVPHALKEWDDHFSMGKPPVKPLSPAEMAGAGSSSASAEAEAPVPGTPPRVPDTIRGLVKDGTPSGTPDRSVAEALAFSTTARRSPSKGTPPGQDPSRPSIPYGPSGTPVEIGPIKEPGGNLTTLYRNPGTNEYFYKWDGKQVFVNSGDVQKLFPKVPRGASKRGDLNVL